MNDYVEAQMLAVRLSRSKMSSREIEALFGISQATVSRLLRGKVRRVAPYTLILDMHENGADIGTLLDDCMQSLRSRAETDPALRNLLVQLSKLMHNA